MSQALTLLALTPRQALRVLVQEALKPGVTVSDLTLARPRVEQGDLMSVDIGVAGAAYEREDFPYFGAAEFTYHRLDMADTFNPLNMAFQVTFPLITSHLIEEIGTALGIVFMEDDYVEELIEAADTPSRPYTIKAAPNSPRWMGQVTVQLHSAG